MTNFAPMKKYKTSDTLTEGDIVEYGIGCDLFKAVLFDKTKPCINQCDMAGTKGHAFCTGFCYRWENGDNFVFVETEQGQRNVTITQTLRSKLDNENY